MRLQFDACTQVESPKIHLARPPTDPRSSRGRTCCLASARPGAAPPVSRSPRAAPRPTFQERADARSSSMSVSLDSSTKRRAARSSAEGMSSRAHSLGLTESRAKAARCREHEEPLASAAKQQDSQPPTAATFFAAARRLRASRSRPLAISAKRANEESTKKEREIELVASLSPCLSRPDEGMERQASLVHFCWRPRARPLGGAAGA